MISVEGRPQWWSLAATRTALRLVPAGGARDRWQQELVAELYGLSRVAQARHTIGVVTRAPALRAAVTARDRVTPPEENIMRKPISCRLHLHRWHTVSAEDGSGRYRECRRCGKEDADGGRPNWFSSGAMG
jgi:hypothetical protein